MDLFAATNMAAVESDPNNIPDNAYDGVVSSSSFVYNPNKDILQHVINYRVAVGPHKGAERGEFFRVLLKPRLANGSAPAKGRVTLDQIATGEPAMNDNNKKWYRKRFEDITGKTDDASVSQYMNKPEMLDKLPVVFGVKRNSEGYPNVSFARQRDEASTAVQGTPTSLGAPTSLGETRPAPDFAQSAPSAPSQPAPVSAPAGQDPWTTGAPASLEGF